MSKFHFSQVSFNGIRIYFDDKKEYVTIINDDDSSEVTMDKEDATELCDAMKALLTALQ